MKKLYQELKGKNGSGVLLTKYKTDEGTLLRGAAVIVSKKQLLSIVHANDKGWHDKKGNVYNFKLKKDVLFIRNLALSLNVKELKKQAFFALIKIKMKSKKKK